MIKILEPSDPVGHDTKRDTPSYVKGTSICVCVCGPMDIPQHVNLGDLHVCGDEMYVYCHMYIHQVYVIKFNRSVW